jgi:hypothetical protein
MAFQIPANVTVPLQYPYTAFTPDAIGALSLTNYTYQQANDPNIAQPNDNIAPVKVSVGLLGLVGVVMWLLWRGGEGV